MKKQLVFGVALVPSFAFAQTKPNPVLLDIDARSAFRFNSICLVDSGIEKESKPKASTRIYYPRPIGTLRTRSNEVYLQALPDQPTVLKAADKSIAYKGLTLLLVNTTDSTQNFETYDRRLYIRQEALNNHGQWKTIEWPQVGGCGFGYKKVSLESNTYWSLAVPRYTGTFKTKLRFHLYGQAPESELTSNEFEGSINPGQFVGLIF